MQNLLSNRAVRLFIILGGFFITNALVAEFIGVKIFSLEETLGWQPFNWSLFGINGTLQLTAGVLLWPVVFIMTDIINEYYGPRGVRLLSYLTAALIAYGFIMIYGAIGLVPADWWIGVGESSGVDNMQNAFAAIFGQSNWIIVGSLVAFLVGQILDAAVFHKVRTVTGERRIWLRATISTAVSQLIDSYVVLYIAFGLGPQQWSFSRLFAVGTVNFGYKILIAILLIPALYLGHYLIDKYLGEALSKQMRQEISEKKL